MTRDASPEVALDEAPSLRAAAARRADRKAHVKQLRARRRQAARARLDSQDLDVKKGVAAILAAQTKLPHTPGVYRMLDSGGAPLYVGKARSLKKRVGSYARLRSHSRRMLRMVAAVRRVEVVHTGNEAEALLLESNMIKEFRPPFNILLRDDKSYPYIHIGGGPWPRVSLHRGARRAPGVYFGPFATTRAVRKTVNVLERAFLLRSCPDSVFAHRKRPCLLYQIRRCAGPCVGRIAPDAYATLVAEARHFLNGNSRALREKMARAMQEASEVMDYEGAARTRDRLRALARIEASQTVDVAALGDADVFGLWREGGRSCVQVFFFRAGRNHGGRAYFPRHDAECGEADVLGAVLGQFYSRHVPPPNVLSSHPLCDVRVIAAALAARAGGQVHLRHPRRGKLRRVTAHAVDNAREALRHRQDAAAGAALRHESLARLLALPYAPRRIEVYDNSHIGGQGAVGVMVAVGHDGFLKNAYRKFNIKDAAAGDDYAMMREVLRRRFQRLLCDTPDRSDEAWPDLLILDGGKGQLGAARDTMADLGLADMPVVAIAKTPSRRPGEERLFLADGRRLAPDPHDATFRYLQALRDEAHRFAIGSQRRRRNVTGSVLDAIAGIGSRRKRALLCRFGSARAVAGAAMDDLVRAEGISRKVAQAVYDHFHEG